MVLGGRELVLVVTIINICAVSHAAMPPRRRGQQPADIDKITSCGSLTAAAAAAATLTGYLGRAFDLAPPPPPPPIELAKDAKRTWQAAGSPGW